ncbi:DUF6705 family protein [Flavobacterium sp. 25HG05S-40]|uniref:DUF6705 family protein n=1 Tax=Flavobacterium sp. 25HG05S-40 TaxID=3458682 RepID=UPI004043A560
MKNILSLLLFFIFAHNQAQTIIPSEDFFNHNSENNIYFKDVNHIFDKFVGTWVYSEGPHYLKIIVTKALRVRDGISTTGIQYKNRIHYYDMITVDYQYKYNGVEIYHVLPPYQTVGGATVFSAISGKIINNPNQINLFYDEPSTTNCIRSRMGQLKLTYLAENVQKLKWERTDKNLQNSPTFCENGTFDESEYQIPANIILIKQ